VEREQVRLVVLDVVVVDREGRTVADLTAEDFEIQAGGKVVAVDTLDVACGAGSLAEPVAALGTARRESPRLPDAPRKIVLAFDYLHLIPARRTEIIESARDAVMRGIAPGDEIMVVALNGGLRIEQQFTSDRDTALASLQRMEYDITLWHPDYHHEHEAVFVDPLVALLDLLGQFPGNKAVVLYSTMRDVPLDLEFDRIAAIAAGSRCSIFPVDAAGLRTALGGPELHAVGAG
jgi:VWFA-related protein